jgi:hypothetical protein
MLTHSFVSSIRIGPLKLFYISIPNNSTNSRISLGYITVCVLSEVQLSSHNLATTTPIYMFLVTNLIHLKSFENRGI